MEKTEAVLGLIEKVDFPVIFEGGGTWPIRGGLRPSIAAVLGEDRGDKWPD